MTPPTASATGRAAPEPGDAAPEPRWRRFTRGRTGDTLWALVDQGTALAASIASFLLLGRTLGAAGYGAFVGLYALIGPFVALSQAGIYLAAMEHVVRLREDPVAVTRSCLSMAAANAALWVPLLSMAALASIEGLSTVAAVLLIGAEFCLNGVLLSSLGVVQAVAGFPAAARLRIAGQLSKLALLAVLAAARALTLTTLAVGQVFTLGAVTAYAIARLSRQLGVAARPGRIRRAHVRSALLYGVGIGASMAQNDGDKFALNAAHYQADAGRYGAAYRLIGIVQLPINALAGGTHLSFLDGTAGSNQLRRAIRLAGVAMAYAVPAVIGLVVLAPLVPRILTKDFSQTVLILRLLAPVVVLRGVGVFAMNGLMGLGLNALRTRLLVGNALLSLVLYAALVPHHSWRGAYVGTIVAEVTLCASAWLALVLCERRRRVRGKP